MKRRIYGLLSVAAIATLGFACKEDPLADSGGTLSRVDLQYTYREVVVADSVQTYVIERDALNTPLPPTATVRSCNTGIVTVGLHDDSPQQRTGFFVKGITYGSTCVIAEAGGLEDTMQVSTFPFSIVVLTGPDTVVSGLTGTYTYQFRDAKGAIVSGVPAPVWSVNDAARAAITAAGGILTGRDSGAVTVSVKGIGTAPAGITGTKGMLVVPAPFDITITPNPADPGQRVNLVRSPTGPIFDANTRVRFGTSVQTFVTGTLTADSVKIAIPDLAAGGALSVGAAGLGPNQITQSPGAFTVNTPATVTGAVSPTSGVPTDTVKIMRGGGEPLFDSDTRAYIGRLRTFLAVTTPDSVLVIVPGIGNTDAQELRLTRIDAADFARKTTFTSTTASLADHYDAINDDPATAPSITANGDYYLVEQGKCTDGVASGSDDCDDFFRVANPSGTDTLFAHVQLDWFSGSDVDILWCRNAACSSVTTGGGATVNNPEVSNVKIPPGATWYLWINYFEPIGVTKDVLRVRFSGLP